ncbi:hypothetical protein GCM10008174_08520 [Methylopila turkensis]|uniref:Tetratrico peptide repeat group 5 domain-containing protein n=2 Tax=Methylopila turkensis TaxID=1437816 RepID=A0A9W6JK20_9HYPH|nr:hypothetical protein GCM10008174_08520 [Methylopila turkensis]
MGQVALRRGQSRSMTLGVAGLRKALVASTTALAVTFAGAGGVLVARAQTEAPADSVDALVARARAAANGSRHAEAADLFRQAMARDPSRRGALLREFADQIAYGGDPKQAVALYREAQGAGLQPTELAVVERHLAAALTWAGSFAESADVWERILATAPGDVEARRGLGDALIAGGRAAANAGANKEAAALFARAIERSPDRQPEIAREFADQTAYAGQPDVAVGLYRDALARSDLSPADRARAERGLAFARLWSGRFSEAIADWERLARATPQDREASGALADALVGAARKAAADGRNAEAATLFRRARRAAPERRLTLLREYADQIAYAGRPAEAIPFYREAMASRSLPADDRKRAARGLAFALLWVNRFDEATGALERLIASGERDAATSTALVDAVVGAARAAAGRADNAGAARRFAKAIRLAPGRRRALIREYADQLLYAGRQREAEVEYRVMLRYADLDGEERRAARLGLARSLAWRGEHEAAVPAYGDLLAERPDDVDGRVGRGESLNTLRRHREALVDFDRALRVAPGLERALRGAGQAETSLGRHRAALARVEPLLDRPDVERDTLVLAAYARRAMGRPDIAFPIAQRTLARHPEAAAAQKLLDEIQAAARPTTLPEVRYIKQEDGLRIRSASVAHTHFFDYGLGELTPQASVTRYWGHPFPKVDIYSAGVSGRRRVSDKFEVDGLLRLNVRDERPGQHVSLNYVATASLLPDDAWRLSLRASRMDLDDPRSIVAGIQTNEFGALVDYTPSYDIRVWARSFYTHYDDGNERVWGQVTAQTRLIESTSDVWFGVRGTAFDFAEELDHGYWNPNRYASAEATAQLYGPLFGKLRYDLQGAAGYEASDPDGSRPIWSASLRLSYEVDPAVTLSAYAAHQVSSANSTGDGFTRSTFGGEAKIRW